MKSQHIHNSSLTRVGKHIVCSILILLAGITLSSRPGLAQDSGAVTLSGLTPRQVLDGSAKLVGPADATQMLRLVIGLQPPNIAEEEQFLKDLQDKKSPLFLQFLTADQWNERFAPSTASEQAVVDWAQSQGLTITNRYSNRLLVDLEGPTATIEKAFQITINNYQLDAKSYFSSDRDPSIPGTLSSIIHSVGGLNNIQVLTPANKTLQEPAFPIYAPGPVKAIGSAGHADGDRTKLPNPSAGSKTTPLITGGAYDPTDIYSSQAYDTNALYNQGHCCNPRNNPGGSPPETTIAIATAGSQAASDMAGFQAQYPYLAYSFGEIPIDGSPGCCDAEGTMDLEWSTAMSNSFGSSANTSTVWMYDGVNNHFSTFTDIYNHILSDGLARVFSTSWGCAEFDCTPQSVMDTDHAIFNSMVGQGWTLVSISHDGGATTSCVKHDAVSYPGSDPNVVASGGTQLYLTSGPVYNWEVGWTGGPSGCANNDGGSGGGVSAYWAAPSYQGVGGNRQVPDVALNADWYYTPQNLYFGGGLGGNGGTSIVAPEVAGFIANANSYLLALGNICGSGSSPCAPIGNANYLLYLASGAPHSPFYDITSGCNNNDITALYGLAYYCAAPGRDLVTGWGSFNMLQLSWAFNWFHVPGYTHPTVTFSGPATNHWYNSDQVVSWTVTAPAQNGYPSDGIAGFTQAWDYDPGDAFGEATPGSGNSFYSGPEYANAINGCLDFTGASCAGSVGQGWHTVDVRAWGNEGEGSTDATYGPIGYDTIPPVTTASLSGTKSGGTYVTAVQVTLTATDNASGVANTFYQVNGGAVRIYSAPFPLTAAGAYTVGFDSVDNAGNVESGKSVSFTITEPTATSLASSKNPSGVGQTATFTAVVSSTSTVTGTATGTVTFKDGASTLATKTLVAGKATFGTAALAFGNHSITASYLGAPFYFASTSPVLVQVVQDVSTTSLASSLNPSTYGQAVTFTATVHHTAAPVPTGPVTFKNGATTLGTVNVNGSGVATFTTSTLTGGTHSITATYAGDSNYLGSKSSTLSQVVNKATTSSAVTSSLNPSNHGQNVTFTATVTSSGGTPAGNVKFMNGAALLGTKALSGGTATFSTTTLTTGSHNITVVYVGNGNFTGSTSPILVQVVN